MISTTVLKNKLCDLLTNQLFVRLPLKFFQKVSFFLQNLRCIDYNQPRSRIAMHRVQKFKKRRNGHQKWSLKKYWKFRGIGVKLAAINEQGDKEYLAEIENDDDSLECDELGNPIKVLRHKNSGTYFGLSKFPANLSPSEVALKRLCRGRTLLQTFPSQSKIETSQQNIPITNSVPTLTEFAFVGSGSEMSESSLLPSEDMDVEKISPADLESIRNVVANVDPTRIVVTPKSSSINYNKEQDVTKFEFRRSYSDLRTIKNGCIFRNTRFQRKYCNKNSELSKIRFNSRLQRNKLTMQGDNNKCLHDFSSKIESNYFAKQEISVAKCFLQKSDVETPIHKLTTNSNGVIQMTKQYVCRAPEENNTSLLFSTKNLSLTKMPNSFNNSNSNMAMSEPDLSKADLRILTIKKEEMTADSIVATNIVTGNRLARTGSGFLRSSIKLISKSMENMLGVTSLNKTKSSRDSLNAELSKEPLTSIKEVDEPKKLAETVCDSSEASANIDFVHSTDNLSDCDKQCFTANNSESFDVVDDNLKMDECDKVIFQDMVELNNNAKDVICNNDVGNQHCNADLRQTLNEVHDKMIAEDQLVMENAENKPTLPPHFPVPPIPNQISTQDNSLQSHYNLRTRTSHNRIQTLTNSGSSTSTNYSVNMSALVHRMFGYSDVQEHQSGHISNHRDGVQTHQMTGCVCGTNNDINSRITRRNVVRLDHNSLWTEFVSDMIVNSRIRRVQIKGV